MVATLKKIPKKVESPRPSKVTGILLRNIMETRGVAVG